MKPDTLLLLIVLFSGVQLSSSQIIGSSVVTSVSVVLGNDSKDDGLQTTVAPVLIEEESPVVPNETASPKPEGVAGVIAALKDIVEKEQQKMDQGKSSNHIIMNRPPATAKGESHGSSPSSRVDESSAEDSAADDDGEDDADTEDEDDDDADDDEADDFMDVTLSVPTGGTTLSSSGAMTTTESPGNTEQSSQVNDTATSAEVNEAIQRISGALLTPGKEDSETPIENIVTDVLTSISDARNSTSQSTSGTTPLTQSSVTATDAFPVTTTTRPYVSSTAGMSNTNPTTKRSKPPVPSTKSPPVVATQPSTKRWQETASTLQVSSNSNGNNVPVRTGYRPTQRPVEMDMSSNMHMGKPHKPMSDKGKMPDTRIPGIQTDENMTTELETEEEFFMDDKVMSTTQSVPVRTKPTRLPAAYSSVHKHKQNGSTSSNRPMDFYDDEIFGYDPYQTFLHGVYVPVVEPPEEDTRDGVATMSQPFMIPSSSLKPQDEPEHHHHVMVTFRPNLKTQNGAQPVRKPVPSLPDYLYRPRPSHLQYQHGAAEDVDPETGLLNVNHNSGSGGLLEENFHVDRLATQPRPILPRPIVDNFTTHHNEAHHGGGHGHHGHGAHGHHGHGDHGHGHHGESSEKRPNFSPAPPGNPGLEATVTNADPEVKAFIDINNRLALRLLSSVTNPISKSSMQYNNMVLSPFTIISSLAMLFLGARGPTAVQLDSLLQLDDMFGFNPHMLYNNITQSFLSQPNTAAALIRLLIADKGKGDILEFFKTRVQHFYDARVEEADYKFAGHLAQSIINQMTRAQIQRHSYEMLNYSLPLGGPLTLLTSTFYDGQFASNKDQSVDSMDFIHLAALGRRLIQVPAVGLKDSFRATYDKDLDATAVEIPYTTRDMSLILLMPGRAGEFSIGGVSSLKSRLTLETWHDLMRGFYPRDPFKVVFPRFRHQSTLNLTYTMQRMGLTDMFLPGVAKFKGINGLADLNLDHSMMHFAEFGTWEKLSDTLTESASQHQYNKNLDLIRILRPHVREHYGSYGEPMSVNDWILMSRNPSKVRSNTNPRPRSSNWQVPGRRRFSARISPMSSRSYAKVRASRTTHFKDALLSSFVPSRKQSKIYYFRQEPAQTEEQTVLRFERPFLYILRHNPTGMILFTGQYTEPVTDTHA